MRQAIVPVLGHHVGCLCDACAPHGVGHVPGFGSFPLPGPSVFDSDMAMGMGATPTSDPVSPFERAGVRPSEGPSSTRFAVEIRWTTLPTSVRPWRRHFWRMLRLVWGRWGDAWGITGECLRLGELPEYMTVCVAFGPIVVVVTMPDRSRERACR